MFVVVLSTLLIMCKLYDSDLHFLILNIKIHSTGLYRFERSIIDKVLIEIDSSRMPVQNPQLYAQALNAADMQRNLAMKQQLGAFPGGSQLRANSFGARNLSQSQ